MNLRIGGYLLVLLVMIITTISAGPSTAANPIYVLDQEGESIPNYSRKLLGLSAVLDYDYAGPNPKHDPRGKRGGGGSKNP